MFAGGVTVCAVARWAKPTSVTSVERSMSNVLRLSIEVGSGIRSGVITADLREVAQLIFLGNYPRTDPLLWFHLQAMSL